MKIEISDEINIPKDGIFIVPEGTKWIGERLYSQLLGRKGR